MVGFALLQLFSKPFFYFLLQKSNLYSNQWHVDETDIKIKKQQHDIWILLDSETRTVIALGRSGVRESNTALIVFKKLHNITNAIAPIIVTDGFDAYHMPLRMEYPESKYTVYSSLGDDAGNHVIESFHKNFKA